jgi:hypothetical protein
MMRRTSTSVGLALLFALARLPAAADARVATTVNFAVSDSGYLDLRGTVPASRVTLIMRNVGWFACRVSR